MKLTFVGIPSGARVQRSLVSLNGRSTDNIVNASNEVIKHNKFKIEKEMHALKASPHKIVVYSGNAAGLWKKIGWCVHGAGSVVCCRKCKLLTGM
jgi:hypothetical protein